MLLINTFMKVYTLSTIKVIRVSYPWKRLYLYTRIYTEQHGSYPSYCGCHLAVPYFFCGQSLSDHWPAPCWCNTLGTDQLPWNRSWVSTKIAPGNQLKPSRYRWRVGASLRYWVFIPTHTHWTLVKGMQMLVAVCPQFECWEVCGID